jgi:hypothetical protein
MLHAKQPHAFDNPLGANPPMPTKADQSVRDCEIREIENSILINAETNVPFSYKDACVKIGPVVGHDPEATRASTEAVTVFIKNTLKL